MVGAQYVLMNGGREKLFLQLFGNYKIVDSPTDISFSGLGTVAPPTVFLFLIRIEITEGVKIA